MALPAEFLRMIERSAAPGRVTIALQHIADARPDALDRMEEFPDLAATVVAVLAASRALARQCVADPGALDVLAGLDEPVPVTVRTSTELVRWKEREYLRISARDLIGRDDLTTVVRNLSSLAETVLSNAWELAGPRVSGIAVIAMGKLGAEELNYASDLDVMFVGEGDVGHLLEVARGCFRVDVDLRPEGRNGPLTRTLDSYSAYWDRWAQPWEFQALLKARPVAGNRELGATFAEASAARVWGRPFGAEELRQVRHLKARAEGEVARRGLTEREVKRGRGGIRDIEFAVQLLQLVHGRHDAALRSRTTLVALSELANAGYVDGQDADRLGAAYRFLRVVEHRLQLVDGAQVHAVPSDPDAVDHLARVMGYRDGPGSTASADLLSDLRHHQTAARAIHEQLFFRPLLELFAGLPVELSADAAATRLAAFGFADAQRTRQALQELTHGLTRTSRLMQQMLPLVLEWLSQSPDPDGGLLGLRNLLASPHRSDLLMARFRDSPESARRLCLLLGTSRPVSAGLERNPELLDDLTVDNPDPSEGLERRIQLALSWRRDVAARIGALRRFKATEEIRIAAADILDLLGSTNEGTSGAVEVVGHRLTRLAEASLAAVLDSLGPSAAPAPPAPPKPAAPPATAEGPHVPMAIIAMGRFGGGELSYASDLDVLLVHDESDPQRVEVAESIAEEVLRLVKGESPADRLYLLDADLRPEGKQGPLARSLGGYDSYYKRWAQTWERQALLRARFVAGDPDLGRRFMDIVESFVWTPLTEAEEREIRRMKARIERERIPARDDPHFHLKLGRGSLSDVEWTVQLLQLRHGIAGAGTMTALRALLDAGAISADDSDSLARAYRFCERTRNRLYLVRGVAGDALPSRADQLAFLARSLGCTSSELRSTYRRLTRRAREVTERVFYGSAPPRQPALD